MSRLPECIALRLTHGRSHPEESLDHWGSDGPIFLVLSVHVTYAGDLRLRVPPPHVDGELCYVESLLFYDGSFYGDWSVIPAAQVLSDPAAHALVQPFDPQKAR